MPSDLIVECASNHGGERPWMSKLIESAALVGARYAKFQSYQTTHLRRDDPQYDWLKHAELSDADHEWLIKECAKVGVEFLTTVYTADRVPFLASLGLKAIKVGSGEAGERSVLEAVARHGWKIYMSTGLWTGDDMDLALDILADHEVVLLHAVSEYPTPTDHANLERIEELRNEADLAVWPRRGWPVGYSDHTEGYWAAITALACGAPVVEVHHSLPGAPRRNVWDKNIGELARIATYARMVDALNTARPMFKEPGEERNHVGRWQA